MASRQGGFKVGRSVVLQPVQDAAQVHVIGYQPPGVVEVVLPDMDEPFGAVFHGKRDGIVLFAFARALKGMTKISWAKAPLLWWALAPRTVIPFSFLPTTRR
nr:hypothetical protein [Desulfofundulus luciae]